MGKAILLTGPPGCGKTTLVERVVSSLRTPAGGFVTREVRQGGRRVGFEVVTLDGVRVWLARVDLASRVRMGKYKVNLEAVEKVAAGSIRAAVRAGKVVVIDEIGPMELLSAPFRQEVEKALCSPSLVLAGVMQCSHAFADRADGFPGTMLLEVRAGNRHSFLGQVLRLASPSG